MYEFHSIEDYKKNGIKNGNEKKQKKDVSRFSMDIL